MDVDNDDVTHLKRMDFFDVCEVALLARHHPKVSLGRTHVTEPLRRVPLSLGGNEEDLDRPTFLFHLTSSMPRFSLPPSKTDSIERRSSYQTSDG